MHTGNFIQYVETMSGSGEKKAKVECCKSSEIKAQA